MVQVIHTFIHCRHLYSASSSGTTRERSQPQRGQSPFSYDPCKVQLCYGSTCVPDALNRKMDVVDVAV